MHRSGWITLLATLFGAGAGAMWMAPQERVAVTMQSASCTLETDASPQRGDEVRVEIPTGGLPSKGAAPADAAVTVVECSDFECPFSRRADGTFEELLADNPDLALFHVLSPLPVGHSSELKARAAAAADRQGEFWRMHDALFELPLETEEGAVRLARALGLDADRFARDLHARSTRDEVMRQRSLCAQAGVRAVPTFFVNGRRVTGALPTGDFQRIIDAERERAGR